MSTFRRFKCDGCGIVFNCDLLPAEELRYCPFCSAGGCVRVTTIAMALCVDCGELIPGDDCDHCAECGGTLCNGCSHSEYGDGCSGCRTQMDAMAHPVAGVM